MALFLSFSIQLQFLDVELRKAFAEVIFLSIYFRVFGFFCCCIIFSAIFRSFTVLMFSRTSVSSVIMASVSILSGV